MILNTRKGICGKELLALLMAVVEISAPTTPLRFTFELGLLEILAQNQDQEYFHISVQMERSIPNIAGYSKSHIYHYTPMDPQYPGKAAQTHCEVSCSWDQPNILFVWRISFQLCKKIS